MEITQHNLYFPEDDNNNNDFWESLWTNIVAIILAIGVAILLEWSMSSCSRKSTSVEIENNTEVQKSSTVERTNSETSTFDFSSLGKTFSNQQSWMNAHVYRRNFDYDSLGNQRVTSEEQIDFDSHKTANDSSTSETNAKANTEKESTEIIRDTITIQNNTHTISTEYVTHVPMLWKLSAYFGWICSVILLVYALANALKVSKRKF